METIGHNQIWSFLEGSTAATKVTNKEIRHGLGHSVNSFFDLAKKVAELQFRNTDYVLLFRGQQADHLNRDKNTSLKPSLFRSEQGVTGNPGPDILIKRFDALRCAGDELKRHYETTDFIGKQRLRRHQILRWAILQHYEVCRTPLLDVTHSLRIAASFASLQANDDACLFVLGVPNLSGAITASAEAGLQILRLSSVCPPSAVRPHLQEGYLLGEYPEMSEYEQKEDYNHHEIDFGRRLVAKFRFHPTSFWKHDTFPKVKKDALSPRATEDPLYKLALEVKEVLDNSTP